MRRSSILVSIGVGICLLADPGVSQAQRARAFTPSSSLGSYRFKSTTSGLMNDAYQFSRSGSGYGGSNPGIVNVTGSSSSLGRSSGPRYGSTSLSGTLMRGGSSDSSGIYSSILKSNSLESYSSSSYSSAVFDPRSSPLPYSGGDLIPLLPKELDIGDAFQMACAASAEAAIKPFVEEQLQRPTPKGSSSGPTAVTKTSSASGETQDIDLGTDAAGVTTTKGSLFTAQQLSKARDLLRRKMYIPALNCFKAARAIDTKNKNALIGMIYCHIMSGRFQVGGLAILELAQDDPDFWLQKPDFHAIFGVTSSELSQRLYDVEPQMDQVLALYRPEDGKQVAEDIKLAYLSKMYIAWLRDNRDAVKEYATLAAQAVPLDAPVQQLYHRISGKAERKDIVLTPIKPMD